MISVCMATYNGAKYIKKQLCSILSQIGPNDELIISDDGSKDGTLENIVGLCDNRIKVFPNNSGRHGVVPNFANALAHASGDIIFFSDQDDIWAPNKVEKIKAELQTVDLVVHDALIMDAQDNISYVNYFSLRPPHMGFWSNLMRNCFVGSCMAFRKEVLNYAFPLPKHILWHDMWIGLIASKHCKVKFIDEKLLYYRRHGDNASATGEKSTFSRWKQLKYRMQMLYYSFER
jgi:glycosyltransferase involved in cell wall biosynthesis